VFTGSLALPRKESSKFASKICCNILDSVTQKTTILVVGTQDSSKLAGYDKSSKHRKAEGLIEKGKQIKIMSEKDFIIMCNDEDNDLNFQIHNTDSKENVLKKIKTTQPEKQSLSIEINLTKGIAEKVEEVFDQFSTEEKKIFFEASKKQQEFIDSIKDCSHEEKITLGNDFHEKLEKIKSSYEEYEIESYVDDDIEILFIIQSEIDELTDLTFDLMKNKIAINEYYEYIDGSIDIIDSELEEGEIPKNVKKYAKLIFKELDKTKDEITTLSNKDS